MFPVPQAFVSVGYRSQVWKGVSREAAAVSPGLGGHLGLTHVLGGSVLSMQRVPTGSGHRAGGSGDTSARDSSSSESRWTRFQIS